MSEHGGARGWRPVVRVLALACCAIYALPVFAPPPAVPPVPPPLDATLSERVFPGVPAAWVWWRLAALGAGAVLATLGTRRDARWGAPAVEPSTAPGSWPAAVAALGLAAWAVRAPVMAKGEQLAFVAALLVPWLASLAAARGDLRWRHREGLAASLLIVVVWAAVWAPIAWRSPWMASFVDCSDVLRLLVRTRAADANVLVDATKPGESALHLVLQGAGLFDLFDVTPTLPIVQAIHGLWVAVSGLLVGWAAAAAVAPWTAPIATAVFLGAPFMAMETLYVGPLFTGVLLSSLYVRCVVAIHTRRSPVGVVAAGLVTGVMTTLPAMVAIGYPGFAVAVWLALRTPRVPAAALVAGVGTFVACLVPVLPGLFQLAALVATYGSGAGEWATGQTVLFGQLNPDLWLFQLNAAAPGPFDALIGSLLSPFVVARNGLRLWGDVIIEPWGAVLAAIGLVACVRGATMRGLLLLALFLASVGMGGLSSYDRASLTRLSAAPVTVSLLAAVGAWTLVTARATRGVPVRQAIVPALALLAAGWFVMVRVNPRILPRSVATIMLEAVPAADVAGALALFPYRGGETQSSPLLVASLVSPPMRSVVYQSVRDLEQAVAGGDVRVLLWGPGIEERDAIGQAVCARWPAAPVYVVTDDAAVSRAFVAVLDGSAWEPAVPRTRWQVQRCPVALPTEGRAAATALATARGHQQAGRRDLAIATLRSAAAQSFLQVPLFDELASALLAEPATPAITAEAVRWARRAVSVSGSCVAGPVNTLLRAYTAQGRHDAARAVRAAESAARAKCADLPATHSLRRLAAAARAGSSGSAAVGSAGDRPTPSSSAADMGTAP